MNCNPSSVHLMLLIKTAVKQFPPKDSLMNLPMQIIKTTVYKEFQQKIYFLTDSYIGDLKFCLST